MIHGVRMMAINYKELLKDSSYDFLRNEEVLGKQIIYLTLSGSVGYGTNKETSDVDIRGVAVETKSHLYGLENFQQYEELKTDTVIYGLKKFISLAIKGNPNILELLGTKDEHVLYMSEEGKMLRDNADIFLSKRVINTFGNYATAQLRRLQNALARDHYPQDEKQKHILNTINSQMHHFKSNYSDFDKGSIKLYKGTSNKQGVDTEILMDINLKDYPLKDFISIYSEMSNIVKAYDKLNHRNRKKTDEKLYKHAMHLIRLLIMGTEILSTGKINTYRNVEHELLMDIRNGKYTFSEIFDMADKYEKAYQESVKITRLPDQPNQVIVEELMIKIYERMVN